MEDKRTIRARKSKRGVEQRYIVMDGLLYYLSDPHDDPTAWFYILEQIQDAVIRQYNDENGHEGIDKAFEAIRRQYYFSNLY